MKPGLSGIPNSVNVLMDSTPPAEQRSTVGCANICSRSDDAVIRVYDEAGNVIETHEQTGDLKEW
jgi:hypothetical protein